MHTQTMPKWSAKRRRYIDTTSLSGTQTQKVLAYLYMRQAPVSRKTLRAVAGLKWWEPDSYIEGLLSKGKIKRVGRGCYVIHKVPVNEAAILIAAVRYVP